MHPKMCPISENSYRFHFQIKLNSIGVFAAQISPYSGNLIEDSFIPYSGTMLDFFCNFVICYFCHFDSFMIASFFYFVTFVILKLFSELVDDVTIKVTKLLCRVQTCKVVIVSRGCQPPPRKITPT